MLHLPVHGYSLVPEGEPGCVGGVGWGGVRVKPTNYVTGRTNNKLDGQLCSYLVQFCNEQNHLCQMFLFY